MIASDEAPDWAGGCSAVLMAVLIASDCILMAVLIASDGRPDCILMAVLIASEPTPRHETRGRVALRLPLIAPARAELGRWS